MNSIDQIKQLEAYTLAYPEEVLLVTVQGEAGVDEVAIFKGFSSSLMRATQTDPDVPILAVGDQIVTISRLRSPFNPDNPQYIQRALTWDQMLPLLAGTG